MEGCSKKDVYTENYTLKVENNHWELISRQVKRLHLLAYQCQAPWTNCYFAFFSKLFTSIFSCLQCRLYYV